jgi:lysophospholipase L1-like esterase
VANIPALEQFPAYQSCRTGAPGRPDGGGSFSCPDPIPTPAALDAMVTSYNSVIATDVAATGATLVDLHAASLTAVQQGTEASLISDDGIDPSTAGNAAIAKLFADAWASRTQPTR